MHSVSQASRNAGRCLVLLSAAALLGCGDDSSSISGKVTYKGEAVRGGSLIFAPAGDAKNPGKPALAELNADGTYTAPAAVPGKNKVIYTPPRTEATSELKPGQSPPPSPWDRLVPKQREVEITTSSSVVDIELVSPR
jgi:hypothetical protein